jgi:hypothetical protein
LALDIIGQAPARPSEEADGVSVDPLLTRLKNGVKNAPENADLARDGIVPGDSLVAEARNEIPVTCCISHVSISTVLRTPAFQCSSTVVFVVCISALELRLTNDDFSAYT